MIPHQNCDDGSLPRSTSTWRRVVKAVRETQREEPEEGETLTVKGFAKPVWTYSVVGLYDGLEKEQSVI